MISEIKDFIKKYEEKQEEMVYNNWVSALVCKHCSCFAVRGTDKSASIELHGCCPNCGKVNLFDHKILRYKYKRKDRHDKEKWTAESWDDVHRDEK